MSNYLGRNTEDLGTEKKKKKYKICFQSKPEFNSSIHSKI